MPTLRTVAWGVVIIFWCVAVLIALVQEAGHAAFALAIVGIANCIALNYFFGWRFGVRRHVLRHLDCPLDRCIELTYAPGIQERIDMLRVLEQEVTRETAARYGVSVLGYGGDLLAHLKGNSEVVPLKYGSFETASGDWQDLPENAIYLVRMDGVPAVVAFVGTESFANEDDDFTPAQARFTAAALRIVAADMSTCQSLRQSLIDRARQSSVWKGKSLIVRGSTDRTHQPVVEFTTIKPVEQSRIVLPEPIFQAIERTVLQQLAEAERLQRNGQRTRTAILLFGPPGTGKTLLTRHLVSRAKGYTTIQLQGFQRSLVRECFRLARYLEPSLIILEDVDLIAVRRQKNQGGTAALHALLDELDGLAPESRCAVVMTTNRPDVLEPALASRPGRVTQAVEFPMPSEPDRQRLLQLFLQAVDAKQVTTADWARRTAGASPAFLEELVRRGVLIALRRQPEDIQAHVTDDDLQQAILEIVELGGQLTRQLLGHRSE